MLYTGAVDTGVEIKCKTGEERINIFFSCQKLALQDTCSCFFFQLLKVFQHTRGVAGSSLMVGPTTSY